LSFAQEATTKAFLLFIAILLAAAASEASPWHGYRHGYRWGRLPGPSIYMQWDDAAALGNQIIAEQQKSLGEVAREYRARKAQEQSSSRDNAQPNNKDIVVPVCPPNK
jgi:hypothetical protein